MSDIWTPFDGDEVPTEHPEAVASTRRRRAGRGTRVALIVSLVVIAGLAAALAWLASARANWEGQNEELRARVETLTDEVSARNARVEELEQVEAQLETLKAEYSAAVNLGAQGSQTAEELEGILQGFEACVKAQREHFAILHDADRYVASSVAESEESILAFCDEVSNAYEAFRDAQE